MGPAHRDNPLRYRRRILTVGVGALGLVFVVGAPFYVDSVEGDLERRVPDELADAGFDGITADFDGQDGTLRCEHPLNDPEAARQAAYRVRGVRAIELDRSCRVNGAADGDASGTSDTVGGDDRAASDTSSVARTAPVSEAAFETVQAALAGSPQLSLFAVLTREAGLATEFGDPSASPVTVFAPTDAAFEALPADVLADLRADPEALLQVLLHHTTNGRLFAADFAAGAIAMRDGASLELDPDVPSIDGGVISITDIEATTGVVHIVDTVLVPDHLDLSESPTAASVSVVYDGGLIELTGVVSTEAVRAVLLAAAGDEPISDELTVDSETGLDAATADALAVLVTAMRTHLTSGMAGFDGRTLFLTGTSPSEDARVAASTVAESVGAKAEVTEPPRATDDDAAHLEAELNALVEASPILFEPGSATISADSLAILDRLAALALRFDGLSVTVQGHTDSVGDPDRNLLLSEARANAVRLALVERGLSPDAVAAEGFGSTRPVLVDGIEDEDASRRVEFVVEAES